MAAADVATPSDYLSARLSLLEREKELTRLQDKLTQERKNLPLVPVSKSWSFTDPHTGKQLSLVDLFEGRKQLVVYHAMFDPEWDQACASCTFFLDHVPDLDHLHTRDTSLVVVSRATPEQIKKYQDAMGFTRFHWYSSHGTSFNYEQKVTIGQSDAGSNNEYNWRSSEEWNEKGMPWFGQGEQPGFSVFVMGGSTEQRGVGKGEAGKVYHSYSMYARAGEKFLGTLHFLDLTPLGRQDRKLEGVQGLGFRRRGEYSKAELDEK